jgi:hypothetical protein
MLRDTCHLVSHDVDLATFLAADAGERYERAFVCYPDEEQSLRVALTVNRLWHRVAGEVVVPVDRFSGLVDAFRVGAPAPLLDRLGGRLRLFPWVSAGCDPKLIAEDLSERLAQLNHERYLAGCLARGEKMGARPTLVEWAMLDEAARRTSREQAGDIGAKLHVIGCSILPRDFDDDGFEFTDGEIEELAKLEQQRWKADAERHGWQWGGERDSLTRRTPDLVDWDRLGTDGREKCRAAIRDIPLILADAGFQVVRMADNEEDRALRLV